MDDHEALKVLVEVGQSKVMKYAIRLKKFREKGIDIKHEEIVYEAELKMWKKKLEDAVKTGREMILELDTSKISKRDSEFREKYCRDPEFSAVVDMLASNVKNDRISMEDLKGALKLVEIKVSGYGEIEGDKKRKEIWQWPSREDFEKLDTNEQTRVLDTMIDDAKYDRGKLKNLPEWDLRYRVLLFDRLVPLLPGRMS